MARPAGRFVLTIDSIMAEAYREESMLEYADQRPELDAPYNSMESEDSLIIEESPSSEELEEVVD